MEKGIITIQKHSKDEGWNFPFSVDFDGHNEGSGSPCKDIEEVELCVQQLKDRHSKNYKLEIKDFRINENTIITRAADCYCKGVVFCVQLAISGF